MSTSYGATPPGITGTHYGGAGLGCPGSLIPSDGLDGPGYLYAGLELPADAGKEIRGPITRWPGGVLTVYEDSGFLYSGPTDYALFRVYVDGQASTTDIGHGAGIGLLFLGVGASQAALSGGITLGDAQPGGALLSEASQISGGPTLEDVSASGSLSSVSPGQSELSGGSALDGVMPGGGLFSSDTPTSATPGYSATRARPVFTATIAGMRRKRA